jgi:hypothetical protein
VQAPRVIAAAVVLFAARAYAQDVARLELSTPPARETVRGPGGWVQVAGRVSSGVHSPCDLMLALDVSASAFMPSGVDVDGDGVVGVLSERGMVRSDGSRRPTRAWTTDPGDTVFELSRVLARRVLESISREDARVGLITFSGESRVRARLGSPDRALRALDALRIPSNPSATHIESAIRIGQDVLEPWAPDGRQKILMVISDGRATSPGPPVIAVQSARRAARAAAQQGVAVHSLAVGPDAMANASTFTELASLTDGNQVYRSETDTLFAFLPVSAADVPLAEVEIANETTGNRGRAVRFFSDGSFDGFVRLAPGANQLSVQARASDGTLFGAARTVYFDPADTSAAELAAIRDLLRTRSLEIELAGRVRSGTRHKQLEIGAEN